MTLGCARNEVDSEELAGRLTDGGWSIVEEPARADAVLVNTCGFIAAAKKDSIDALLEAADLADGRPVVAVGCMAERYGHELASALPEASAVLGFDDYPAIASRLDAIVRGERPEAHTPRDRRTLLPISPAARSASAVSTPGHGGSVDAALPPGPGPRTLRRRLSGGPVAALKLASGCDRRCAFCAIPMFRGSFVSRRPTDVLAEARWLGSQGVRELFLVSENSTSYGKDLGDLALLEKLLPELTAVDGVDRVRVSYLQPAEVRPGLLDAMATVPGVMPWYDLSFQHASPTVLRRMRRFGGTEPFLDLLGRVRERQPLAGARSNVIVGFPGETEADVDELEGFLTQARLDVVGVFGYSDEDGTEAEGLDGTLAPEVVAERVERLTALIEELTAQRALERVGERVTVLVEEHDDDDPSVAVGRAEHQGPDVDGVCLVRGRDGVSPAGVGTYVAGVVVDAVGVDLVVEAG